jgi:hypothetical protein
MININLSNRESYDGPAELYKHLLYNLTWLFQIFDLKQTISRNNLQYSASSRPKMMVCLLYYYDEFVSIRNQIMELGRLNESAQAIETYE